MSQSNRARKTDLNLTAAQYNLTICLNSNTEDLGSKTQTLSGFQGQSSYRGLGYIGPEAETVLLNPHEILTFR